jgi:D-lactate dehydrogenase (cytochrome)/glycolate oxidase
VPGPASGLTAAHERFLRGLFPGDGCLLDPERTHVFGADASRLHGAPWAVVRPEGTGQVRELLAWAQAERVPIIPRARGTNTVGACVPRAGARGAEGGVVVSALKLNRILEVSPDDFLAVAEPGVVTAEFQAEVGRHGLFYPPDPASVRFSTLGGNVATCAGGMRAVKYGVTRDYILGLEAVLPGGEVIRTGGRTHKNVVGLDLTRLLVGSEGTLAFITSITAKLLPRPEASASLLAGFESLDAALDGAAAVFRSGILPSALELMAEETLDAVSALRSGDVPWPAGVRALLLLRLDGSSAAVAGDLKVLGAALAGAMALIEAVAPAEEELLWEPRRLINPASFRIRPDKLSDDVTVPRGTVGEAIRGYREIARARRVPILAFGHLGDGNIHVNVMHDGRDPDETARAQAAKAEITRLTLSLGGVLSGEHGVGLVKAPYISGQLGPVELRLMAEIKRAFDPRGIMNPGKGY